MSGGERLLRRIVIPVGGTDSEFEAQEQALRFAAALEVPLVAVHVHTDPSDPPKDLYRFLEDAARRWDVSLETRTIQGTDVAEELLAELDAMDMVVIGSRRAATRYHLASVAERLLREAPGPVQVVRIG